ncbi:MAG TPA: DUF6803 family protein [Azospirillaceae bacterium]|nr:DUF6803 family protein [Azospirillaceae bacterium]
MPMTTYMELLTDPLSLILFMAVPVILAETVAITELHVLYTRRFSGPVRSLNRWAGLVAGFYFTGVFLYLLVSAVVPLTQSGGWRGPIDVVAVGFYLLGVVPLGGLALLEAGLIARGRGDMEKLRLHAVLVGIFLVTAHVAMIAGMMDPRLAGWSGPLPPHVH